MRNIVHLHCPGTVQLLPYENTEAYTTMSLEAFRNPYCRYCCAACTLCNRIDKHLIVNNPQTRAIQRKAYLCTKVKMMEANSSIVQLSVGHLSRLSVCRAGQTCEQRDCLVVLLYPSSVCGAESPKNVNCHASYRMQIIFVWRYSVLENMINGSP